MPFLKRLPVAAAEAAQDKETAGSETKVVDVEIRFMELRGVLFSCYSVMLQDPISSDPAVICDNEQLHTWLHHSDNYCITLDTMCSFRQKQPTHRCANMRSRTHTHTP